jgi:spore coat protein JB
MDSKMTKDDLLRTIQELSFYAVELNLFLDTHPNNTQALQDYNYILQQLEQFKQLYAQKYGSLKNFGEAKVSGNYWSWASDNEPWPWENRQEDNYVGL